MKNEKCKMKNQDGLQVTEALPYFAICILQFALCILRFPFCILRLRNGGTYDRDGWEIE
jgi:hypothetical protein